ncbi:MAG: enoyl-CoA hydratase/isomerase family protein [Pseudomonadota bacterium]
MHDMIETTLADGIATMAFARPEALNAVTMTLADGVVATCAELNADPTVRAIVLTGQGRAFCAGVDLAEGHGQTPDTVPAWFTRVASTYRAILAVDKPVVAAINGVAAGAGFQMALVSDMRLAAEGARMGQPEINAGIPSIMGSYWMSFHLPRSVNQDLSLTGRLMTADEAMGHGLLHKVVAPDDLAAEAHALATQLAGKPPRAWARTKARFRRLALAEFETTLAEAIEGQQETYATGEPQAIMGEFLARRTAKQS